MKIVYIFIFILNILSYKLFVASTSLLGIDFGNEFIKVSIVSPGKGFNILINNQSKRKITNVISFAGKSRSYDEEANIFSTKHPHLTLINSNSLLGYNLFDKLKKKENFNIENYDENDEFYNDINNYDFYSDIASKYYAYDYYIDHKRGTINIKLKNEMILSSEEITANILNYIKKLAYTHLNIDYKINKNLNVNIGCVISVPCNYSQRKKQALLNATKIAGLELLGIINGVTAAAIHNVHDLPLNTTKLTMYLDVGSKNVNVGIATISNVEKDKVHSRSVRVYACESLENSSGNKIDIILAEYLRKKFEEKYDVSIIDDKKAMRKLLIAANKAKLLLSAKKSADVFIESLYNNKSLSENITRQHFEELIVETIDNIKIPINNALKKASFELKDIEALELIGSAWRIPRVLNEITNFFHPLKVGMHLNSDEAITMGSLFTAAYNSPNFRLRNLEYFDIISNDYHILVSYDDPSNDEKNNTPKELISYNTRYPVNKSVFLKYKDNLKFSVYENGKMITQYSIVNLDESTKKKYEHLDTPKINLKFRLDKFGILNLEKIIVIYEEEKEYIEVQKEKSTENKEANEESKDSKEESGEESKDSKEESREESKDSKEESREESKEKSEEESKEESREESKEKSKEESKEESKKESKDSKDSKDESKEESKGESAGEKKEGIKDTKKKTEIIKHKIPLTYEARSMKPLPLNNEEIKNKRELLKILDDHDINIFLKSEAKNNLESFIYETRSKMKQDIFKKVSKEETRNEYLSKLEEYEEWLYVENDEPLENVNTKIKELEDIFIPIKERAYELEVRDRVIEKTNLKIKEMKEKIKEISEKKPWATDTIKMVNDSLEKEILWWNNAQDEQKKLDNYSAPFFKSNEVELRFKSIDSLIKTLEKLKKPIEKKETKENNKNTDKSNSEKEKNPEKENSEKENNLEKDNNSEKENNLEKDNNSEKENNLEKDNNSEKENNLEKDNKEDNYKTINESNINVKNEQNQNKSNDNIDQNKNNTFEQKDEL
ncbi:heat shock protein 110, putative [Plasmodium relictum]|uniref:Heat shock protein 110, putative n=1 Tax=Plasmodium relictum TaxID=85471 RepID=A0A1J1H9J4_PLARL|nr:heat shock protein 110, putative [Plasmodium relictum]CRH01650.1 heat shock protein 110, putative [Plasmodium relictum]